MNDKEWKTIDEWNWEEENAKRKAQEKQVGGSHYQLPIQPIEFIHKNGLNFCQGNIVKYVTRYKDKNGKEDLEKALHYIELLIEMEYPSEEK